jgi:hypothetical protein
MPAEPGTLGTRCWKGFYMQVELLLSMSLIVGVGVAIVLQ